MQVVRVSLILAIAGALSAGCTKAQFKPKLVEQKTVGDLVTQLNSAATDPNQTDGGSGGAQSNSDGGNVGIGTGDPVAENNNPTQLTPENIGQFVDPEQIVPCDTADTKIISIEAINAYLQGACDLEERLEDLIGNCDSNGCSCDDDSSSADDDSTSADDMSADDDSNSSDSNCTSCQANNSTGQMSTSSSSNSVSRIFSDFDMTQGSLCIRVCDRGCVDDDKSSDGDSTSSDDDK